MKTVKIQKGDYNITGIIEIPDLDIRLLGETGTRLIPTISPCIVGIGPENIQCKNCDNRLVSAILRPQVEKINIVCPECETENHI